MPNGKDHEGKDKSAPAKGDSKFSQDEIIDVIADDVYELVSSGEVDMTSPEHVYADVKRIVEKAMNSGT